MFTRLKNFFKSRARLDRERGYYDKLPIPGRTDRTASPAEQVDELLSKLYGIKKLVPIKRTYYKTTPWARFRIFRDRYAKWPNPKELLAILFPSEWLLEKLWPKWDPTDKNAQVAPEAGYYDSETGRVYDSKHRLIRTRNPGA